MTQTTLWLLPLVLGAFFGMVNAFRLGLRWSWGLLIQHGIVLVIALLGLYVMPKYDWLCSYLGWGFMLSYTIIARLFLSKMTQALGLLRTEEAVSRARWLGFMMWGPPGKFWLDLAFMINFYLRGDSAAAETLYQKWQKFGLPRHISESLTAYAMIGLLVKRDWNSAIAKFEDATSLYSSELAAGKKNVRFPSQVVMPAVRAFNETGRYREARESLALADLAGSSYGRESLETFFLSYFALLGAEEQVNHILFSMKEYRSALPEHARLYWKARCAAECGDFNAAILSYADSLRKTPEKDSAWRERTQQQMKFAQSQLISGQLQERNPEAETERKLSIEFGQSLLRRCYAVADIMNSRKPPLAVRSLTGVISVMFICSPHPYIMSQSSNFIYKNGFLAANLVYAGQWWRLITYQFLHFGLSHLLMNLFGLVWFGRFVENVYGSLRFLVIFFMSGILSGALQMVMARPDDQAIGASGAIMGIFGAGLAATLRLKNVLPPQLRRHELNWMIALALTQVIFDQAVNFLFPAKHDSTSEVTVAAAAHLGGMVSGFVLGYLLPMRKLGTEE